MASCCCLQPFTVPRRGRGSVWEIPLQAFWGRVFNIADKTVGSFQNTKVMFLFTSELLQKLLTHCKPVTPFAFQSTSLFFFFLSRWNKRSGRISNNLYVCNCSYSWALSWLCLWLCFVQVQDLWWSTAGILSPLSHYFCLKPCGSL